MTAAPSSSANAELSPANFAVWLIGSAVGIGLLAAAATHLPVQIRKPLLLPLAFGAVSGWASGRFAHGLQAARPAVVAVLTGLLVAGGIILIARQIHLAQSAEVRQAIAKRGLEKDPLVEKFERFLADAPEKETADERRQREEMRKEVEDSRRRREDQTARERELLTFSGYLRQRVPRAWGEWSAPWPIAFWVVELIAGASMGAWLAGREVRRPMMDPVSEKSVEEPGNLSS